MPKLKQLASSGRTWFLILGVVGGMSLWVWYLDHQKMNLISQQQRLYSSYKSSHSIPEVVAPCKLEVGGPNLGGRKGFVISVTDSEFHAVHYDMAGARRPAAEDEVSFIAALAQSTRHVGNYGIAKEGFSSIVDLTIIDPTKNCIILTRHFENLPPDAIRVKRSERLGAYGTEGEPIDSIPGSTIRSNWASMADSEVESARRCLKS
jgi:hypothetical protein